MNSGGKQIEEKAEAIIDNYQRNKGLLISILQDIQTEYNYLPKEALIQVSRSLDVPLSQVYSVVTFFKAFSLEPRGRHLINVCLGTACHVRGGVKFWKVLNGSWESIQVKPPVTVSLL